MNSVNLCASLSTYRIDIEYYFERHKGILPSVMMSEIKITIALGNVHNSQV